MTTMQQWIKAGFKAPQTLAKVVVTPMGQVGAIGLLGICIGFMTWAATASPVVKDNCVYTVGQVTLSIFTDTGGTVEPINVPDAGKDLHPIVSGQKLCEACKKDESADKQCNSYAGNNENDADGVTITHEILLDGNGSLKHQYYFFAFGPAGGFTPPSCDICPKGATSQPW